MNYRILPPSEWKGMQAIGERLGRDLPTNMTTLIVVAENDEGTMVGFTLLECKPFLEPATVAPGHEDEVDYSEMVAKLDELFTGTKVEVVSLSPDRKTGKTYESVGMRQLPMRVWTKSLGNTEKGSKYLDDEASR